MDNKDTGILLSKQNITLHRFYFKQMLKLMGIKVKYKALAKSAEYNQYGELGKNQVLDYKEPIDVWCIYQENPTQQTAKKIGWNTELSKGATLIVVPYDTPEIQVGCQFEIPPGIDNAKPGLFRILKMQTTAVYPSEITCELGPVLINTTEQTQTEDYSKSNFNFVADLEEEEGY